tara:strand:- start:441 stop:2117 length:1677 start_codon:yes stop_codon:yes gene_type:complete
MNNASLELGGTNWAEKEGSLLGYAVNDTNNKYSAKEFTFGRGTNLSATRIGKTGLIEKGRENLLLQSNQFDTTWLNQLGTGTITSGQPGYDSTNNAWEITKDTSTSRSVRQPISSSGVLTYSVYVKAGTLNDAALRVDTTAGASQVLFDLTDGSSTLVGGIAISHNSVNIGNGWYRCIVIVNATITNVHIYVDRDGTTAGSIYIQDAQLEQGLVATPYIPTTTTIAQAGVLETTPRLNYTTGVANPYLLLEPSRTQLAGYSEYFDGWNNKTNVTITSNYTTSPEGLQNASRLVFTGNGFLLNSGAPTQVSGTQYTLSCYAKRNDSGTQSFGFFKNGTGAVDSAMTLTSEWKRFDYTYTAGNSSQLGLAGVIGADVSIYGFQAEAAPYATSYIPNHSGGTITRAADTSSKADASEEIGQTEGVVFVEIEYHENNTNSQIFELYGSGGFSRIFLQAKSLNELRATVTTNSAFNFNSAANFLVNGSTYKIALAYKSGDFSLYVNGSNISTGTSSWTTAETINGIQIGQTFNNSLIEKVIVKQAAIYKERLTNTELATLTTI